MENVVAGVIKDFHAQGLHHEIRPIVFNVSAWAAKYLYLKLGPRDLPETLTFLDKTWQRFLPEMPFEYHFINDDLTQAHYENEIRTSQALTVFSALTIFVACLGLLGLAAFTAEQRTKEIGIRKILGANIRTIVLLLSKEFVILVGISCIIACPIAFVMMQKWLQNFAYRIDLNINVFLLGGALSLVIALGTISYQALKAARANPINALRNE